MAAAGKDRPAVDAAAAAAVGAGDVASLQLAAATNIDLLYPLVKVKELLGPAVELRFEVFGRDAVFWREKSDSGG